MILVEYNGDPIRQIYKYKDIDKHIFYLNQQSLDEICVYAKLIQDGIPSFFDDIKTDAIFYIKEGIYGDSQYPDSYIGIEIINQDEFFFKIAAIYSNDFQYIAPLNGIKLYFRNKIKTIYKYSPEDFEHD